jgi:hypothetical protein
MKRDNKGLDKDFKEAEESLKEALGEAERIALKQVQGEVDKLIDSTGVKIKVTPAFIRKVLSSIVKHVKGIYFISNADIEEKINCQEISYEDCKRELRQCVLFNYWSLQKFKTHLKLSKVCREQAKKLIEEDRNLKDRSVENLNRQVEKAYKLTGKNKVNHR